MIYNSFLCVFEHFLLSLYLYFFWFYSWLQSVVPLALHFSLFTHASHQTFSPVNVFQYYDVGNLSQYLGQRIQYYSYR